MTNFDREAEAAGNGNLCFGGFSTFDTTVRRRTGGVALLDFGSKGVLAVAAL